ncbi:MAG: phosphate ABC transporter permease PstA [Desulfomonile sp.]|nr:phosphate ABC transporter permease PstA [Desulfomonile sp.]
MKSDPHRAVTLPLLLKKEEPAPVLPTDHTGQDAGPVVPPAESVGKELSRMQIERRRSTAWDFRARGEPFVWGLGGALAVGIIMILGFIALVVYNGIMTFYPQPLEVVSLRGGGTVAGELARVESFRPGPDILQQLPEDIRARIGNDKGFARRFLYRTGNYDLYNEDFRWVPEYDVVKRSTPKELYFFERLEWGPFIGTIKSIDLKDVVVDGAALKTGTLNEAMDQAAARRSRIRQLERNEMGKINHYLERGRLALKKVEMTHGEHSPQYRQAQREYREAAAKLEAQHAELSKEAQLIKDQDSKFTVTLADVEGKEKTLKLSEIVRFYPANSLTFTDKLRIYFSRWWEFLSQEPREANTEGGVMPAIFGTFCMTVLLALAVAPFGVVAALYLREYAKQGKLVSLVRVCVNNLAGVPSIVYGVFGLGFFAYVLGGSIDALLFPERLPNPTYGTGGLLWASLTLALLTVPVVIVATEEALAAVPQSMREGSLACGASKWQTIKYIVLPRAMPGIMTGLILAMARGAGEVAPLMLVGVVKLAPELPIDSIFPYIHLERSFMHLGFHIYDVGFQSRNSEAARPMVYVTTFLLISLVFALNAASIMIRNRLKKKFFGGHF